MKYKFLRFSLLSALVLLLGGTAVGAFRAAAAAENDSSDGQETEKKVASWAVSDAPAAGTQFNMQAPDSNEDVAQIAFGAMEPGWTTGSNNIDVTYNNNKYSFSAYATTKSINGSDKTNLAANGSTVSNYLAFTPKYDGTLIVVVYKVGKDKELYLVEDGQNIQGTLVATETEFTSPHKLTSEYSGGVKFQVKANSNYTISVKNSKGQWQGVIYDYTNGGTSSTVSWAVSKDEAPEAGKSFNVQDQNDDVLAIAFGSLETEWSKGDGKVEITYPAQNGKLYTFSTYASTNTINGSDKANLPANGSEVGNYMTFVPKYNGTVVVAVHNSGDKATCLYEDGVQKAGTLIGDGTKSIDFNGQEGLKGKNGSDDNYTGGIQFDVKVGSTYTISITGSKGRWNGVIYEYEAPVSDSGSGDTDTPAVTLPDNLPDGYTCWDFTKWSEETVNNLKAETDKNNNEVTGDGNWSDIEDTGKPETNYGCFWSYSSQNISDKGYLMINGKEISETEGLIWSATDVEARSLAIAVNYPSTSIGQYAGGAYLWLGAKVTSFTIPGVKAGSTIYMGVESHKNGDAGEDRGVELYYNKDGVETKLKGTDGNDVALPRAYTPQEWSVPEDADERVDIIVKNIKGCHIYYICADSDPNYVAGEETINKITPVAFTSAPTGASPITVYDTDDKTTAVMTYYFGKVDDWTTGATQNPNSPGNIDIIYNSNKYSFSTYATTTSKNGSKEVLNQDGTSVNNYVVFAPQYAGTLIIGVHNQGNSKYIGSGAVKEDGVTSDESDKITRIFENGKQISATLIGTDGKTNILFDGTKDMYQLNGKNYTGGILIKVKAGSVYTISVPGSKGRWNGFIYDYKYPAKAEEDGTAPEITLSRSGVDLTLGESVTVTARVSPNKPDESLHWVSDDPRIASVVGNGKEAEISAVSPGLAIIKCYWEPDESFEGEADERVEASIAVWVNDVNLYAAPMVKYYDFTTMGTVTPSLNSKSAGNIYSELQKKNVPVKYCTTAGLENLALSGVDKDGAKGWRITGSGLQEGKTPSNETTASAALGGLKKGQVVEFIYTGNDFISAFDGSDDGAAKTVVLNAKPGRVAFKMQEDGMLGFELAIEQYIKQIYIYNTDDVVETEAVYALQKDETHKAGETVDITLNRETVATLTFGFAGGADFKPAKANSVGDYFVAYTEGNDENVDSEENPTKGTVYTIKPKYDGVIEVGVVLNANKEFYILENDTALAKYNGITVSDKYYGTYKFEVKGGSEYKVYAAGTKLGFYGLVYTIGATLEEEGRPALGDRTWDFTNWSEETVNNLKEEAKAGMTGGNWSDIEKNDGSTSSTEGNCFWSYAENVSANGYLTANGQEIEELKGLKFNKETVKKRSLAIAVNYPETSLGTYHGPSYLWLGSKELEYFVIPDVAAGATIKIGVESHNNADARGVELWAGDTKVSGPAVPTTYEEQTWTLKTTKTEDITVVNTNGCHIYFIEVKGGGQVSGGKTGKATYALQVDEAHASGDVVEVEFEGETVATLTFGEAGGPDFSAAVADSHIDGFVASTGGNNVNGNQEGGTFYVINPVYDGTIEVGVILNADKKFYVEEDGEALADYDGITVSEKYYDKFTFDVKGGSEYKVYCAGSKLGFYGFNYEFAMPGGDEPSTGKTAEVTYALQVDETHASGDTVEVEFEDETVATLTFGEAGGPDFSAAVADSHIDGFVASTGGNNVNGNQEGGTFYVINPVYDGTIEVGVILNADKKFYVEEDGKALADYDGITVSEKYYDKFTFDVKGGSEYKVYCAGSKLGFYGFNYKFIVPGSDEPEDDVPTGVIETVKPQFEDGAIYNLQGQKVMKPLKKGLYIIGGKKVMIK